MRAFFDMPRDLYLELKAIMNKKKVKTISPEITNFIRDWVRKNRIKENGN